MLISIVIAFATINRSIQIIKIMAVCYVYEGIYWVVDLFREYYTYFAHRVFERAAKNIILIS